VKQAYRVLREKLETLVLLVERVQLEPLVPGVQLVLQVLVVQKELLGVKETQEIQALLV